MTTLKARQIPIMPGLILMVFLSLTISANAQEATSTTSEDRQTGETRLQERETRTEERQEERAEAIEERQDIRTERIEERQMVRDERQIALTEIRQQRIINLSANISNRMEAAIERLFNLIGRLEERITVLKQGGAATELAEAKLREATQLLSEARAKLANIDDLVVNATTATEPKSAWQNVRQTYIDTGILIRNSHQALRETIALLKTAVAEAELKRGIVENADKQATTTIE